MKLLQEQIKQVLSLGLPGAKAQLKLAPEGRELTGQSKYTVNASVLIPIYMAVDGEYHTVFMKRTSYKGHHSAQISFPGGKFEPADKTLENTATRETEEEIGLSQKSVQIIGKITELYIPVSNFQVHPYIGAYAKEAIFTLEESEVEYVISSSLKELISLPISKKEMQFEGHTYQVPYYSIKNEMIWGATAMILSEFIEIIKHPTIKKLL